MYFSSRHGARALLVWAWCTATASAVARLAVPTLGGPDTPPTEVADLLVTGSAWAALAAAGWLWVVATAVAIDVLRAGPAAVRAGGGHLRRMLLVACGVAALAAAPPAAGEPGPAVPASADARPDHPLAGLPLPDRATGGETSQRSPEGPQDRVRRTRPGPSVARVRPGDSLWTIAAAALGPGATAADVAAYWPRVHRANRRVVGPDPDLIQPGQRLDLPPHPTTAPGGTP